MTRDGVSGAHKLQVPFDSEDSDMNRELFQRQRSRDFGWKQIEGITLLIGARIKKILGLNALPKQIRTAMKFGFQYPHVPVPQADDVRIAIDRLNEQIAVPVLNVVVITTFAPFTQD